MDKQDVINTFIRNGISSVGCGGNKITSEGLYESLSKLLDYAAEQGGGSSSPTQPRIQPSPSVSITLNEAGEYEVGTKKAPTYSASFNPGRYVAGSTTQETNVTITGWTVSDGSGQIKTTQTGSFNEFTIGDDTNYSLTVTGNGTQGDVAKDSQGGQSNPIVQVPATSYTSTSSAIRGYRAYFAGAKLENTSTINSSYIRTLSSSGKGGTSTFDFTIEVGSKRVIIALPEGTLKTVTFRGFDAGVDNFVLSRIAVEGKDGYQSINYNVYVYEPDSAFASQEVYTVTIQK